MIAIGNSYAAVNLILINLNFKLKTVSQSHVSKARWPHVLVANLLDGISVTVETSTGQS